MQFLMMVVHLPSGELVFSDNNNVTDGNVNGGQETADGVGSANGTIRSF